MDSDDYETLDDEYKIQENNIDPQFYKWNELHNEDLTITKADDEETSRYAQSKQIRKDNKALNRQETDKNSIFRQPSAHVDAHDYCPICSEKYVSVCRCIKSDRKCKNGHQWHIENGKVKLGDSHRR